MEALRSGRAFTINDTDASLSSLSPPSCRIKPVTDSPAAAEDGGDRGTKLRHLVRQCGHGTLETAPVERIEAIRHPLQHFDGGSHHCLC